MKRGGLSVAVIGAGLAGVAAARTLSAAGVSVQLFEKSPRVGGRMATRHAVVPDLGSAAFDHGCQYLVPRGEEFSALIRTLVAARVLKVWAEPIPGVSAPVFIGVHGMRSVVEHLAAGLSVCHRRVLRVEFASDLDGFRVWVQNDGGEAAVPAAAVVLTPPVPQSVALLDAGGVTIPTRDRLRDVIYDCCLAYMATVDGISDRSGSSAFPTSGNVAWAADNFRRGVSPVGPSLTLHATPEFTEVSLGVGPDSLRDFLFPADAPWSGGRELIAAVHRWRYSRPIAGYDNLFARVAPRLLLAGDGFGPFRNAEAAFASGRAAAKHLLAEL